jgi:hypothetical protein
MARIGRPPKKARKRLSKQVQLRFTEDDWRAIKKWAGSGDCADWMRRVLLRELAEPRVVVEM